MLENEPTGVPGDEPEQTHDTQEAAATAATNESGGEAAKRPRRRAASRPAGPPQPKAEEQESSAPTAEGAAAASAEPKPKRARKTAAKKVAATEPEPAPEDGDGQSAPAANQSALAAKKTTRTRTRKKAEAAEETAEQAAVDRSAASADTGQTGVGTQTTGALADRAAAASADAGQTGGAATGDRAAAANADAGQTGARAAGRGRGTAATRGRAAADRSAAASADAVQAGGGAQAAAGTATEAEASGHVAGRGRAAAEQPAADTESAAEQPARRTRTRSRRTVEPAESSETVETTGQPASATVETTGQPAPATAETPRTALSSPFANPFAAPQLPATSAKAKPAKTEAAEARQQPEAEAEPEAKPKTRTRRRAASAPAGPPRAPEQGGESEAESGTTAQSEPEAVDLDSLSPADRARAVIAARAAAPAAGVLFQAPDLTAAAQKATPKAATKAAEAEAEAEAEEEPEEEAEAAPTRRTRTRNRNRNRAEQAEAAEPKTEAATRAEAAEEEEDEDEDDATGSSSRRRRRRRRRAGTDTVEVSPDDPPNTVVKVRETRVRTRERKGGLVVDDDVQGVRGSTRLEAKKQRRREGRDTGRRRAPLITEAEFLARRESVERVMLVRQSGDRTQIGVLEDGVLVEHYVNRAQSASYVGNVYLGKVQNVLPSMEAAFVDIGKGRNAVLYAGEVNFDAAGITGQAKRIESVLKSGQAVLTQVTKDPIGHKGARLTSQISLPGRYLVYVPEGSMTGISRKLPENERNRLKTILKAVVPENAGVIVRTAAEGATEDELRRDVERLSAQWEEIQRRAQASASSAPTLLYGEPDLTVRVVRDIFNEDFSQLIVSGDQAWDTIRGYVGGVAPDLAPRLERWTSEQDVFAVYRVDEQLAKALDRKVWLPSGGSLVIDRTEAMVVIDVNTGKFTGSGGNLEETVTRNNIEAAEEIVRQLRLRDLGGIIVIDFIDMVLESNRDLVMRRLLECLGRDRTKHQVAEVTSLGLVQMTRKRVGQGLLEAFSETCDKCNGRGVLVHMEPVPHSHGHGDDAQHERGGRGQGGQGQQGRNGRAAGGAEAGPEAKAELKTEPGPDAAGAEEYGEHETGRGRRKRRKPHGHVDRRQHFDPQYDLDGVPEDFRDFADGELAVAGPVTVSTRTDGTEAEPVEVVAVSEHSHVDEVADHSHVVAPIVTPDDVVAVEEADVAERLAHGDAQAHIVYAPYANGDTGAAADRDETEGAEVQTESEPALVAASPESSAEAPKRRGLRVRRAAKRPAGPPTPHS